MIRGSGSINLSRSTGRSQMIRTKAAIQKIKQRLKRWKKVSAHKLARELCISQTSVRRVLKNDVKLRAYKMQTEPLLADEHKEKRMKFAN